MPRQKRQNRIWYSRKKASLFYKLNVRYDCVYNMPASQLDIAAQRRLLTSNLQAIINMNQPFSNLTQLMRRSRILALWWIKHDGVRKDEQ